MKLSKRIIALALVTVLCALCLASCGEEEESFYGGDAEIGVYDPYDNNYKLPVDMGEKISVAGKSYTFVDTNNPEDPCIEVRDQLGELSVTAGNALKKLYLNSRFIFTDENKVMFESGNADSSLFFEMDETEGVRDGNVLTVKNTNKNGITYDVRIEIHEQRIYVIHNGHHLNQEGTYATLVFRTQVD